MNSVLIFVVVDLTSPTVLAGILRSALVCDSLMKYVGFFIEGCLSFQKVPKLLDTVSEHLLDIWSHSPLFLNSITATNFSLYKKK